MFNPKRGKSDIDLVACNSIRTSSPLGTQLSRMLRASLWSKQER